MHASETTTTKQQQLKNNGLDILIAADDVSRWPFSVGALVKIAAFLGSLSWPSEVPDLGSRGISDVELLILCERWPGVRLRTEESVPKYRRPGRPMSVSAAPLCPDADIWKLCRVLGNLMRALRGLPGKVYSWENWCQSWSAAAHWLGKVLSWTHL